MSTRRQKSRRQSGFTMIEMLIVVALIGIVASKLVDAFHRPAIVLSIEDGVAHDVLVVGEHRIPFVRAIVPVPEIEASRVAVGQPVQVSVDGLPGRVFKGLRMSGHMGHEQVTTLNLEVVSADVERNLLLVKGSVPGPNGGVVIVRNAVKGK